MEDSQSFDADKQTAETNADKHIVETANASQTDAAPALDSLPTELIEQVASLLDEKALRSLRLSNKALRQKSSDSFRYFPFRHTLVHLSQEDIARVIAILRRRNAFGGVKSLTFVCNSHDSNEDLYDLLLDLMKPMTNLHTVRIYCPCIPDHFRAVAALKPFKLRELRLAHGTYDMQVVKDCLVQHAKNLRRLYACNLRWTQRCWPDFLDQILNGMNLKRMEIDIGDFEEERLRAMTGVCRPAEEKAVTFTNSGSGETEEYKWDGLEFFATGSEAVKLGVLEVKKDLEGRDL